jgi:acyl-CoA thioester hydrolase
VTRKYRFLRAGQLLARAETKWVYVDIKSGRPKRIPEELLASFEAVPDDDPELGRLTEG